MSQETVNKPGDCQKASQFIFGTKSYEIKLSVRFQALEFTGVEDPVNSKQYPVKADKLPDQRPLTGPAMSSFPL
jgi:hypothetical protein